MASEIQELAGLIRSVPDFPKKGIDFKDITTLLQDGPALKQVVDHFAERYTGKAVDAVVAVEARGFILGGALAIPADEPPWMNSVIVGPRSLDRRKNVAAQIVG